MFVTGTPPRRRRPFDGVDDDRVRQRARLVVVFGRLVGGRGDHGDAVVVGVVDRFAREHRVVEVPSASCTTSTPRSVA